VLQSQSFEISTEFQPTGDQPQAIDLLVGVRKKKIQTLKILQHARDEAHRFGVLYNRSLRKM